MKDRTVSWMEGKITEVLAKNPTITTYLALSAMVLEDVRSIEEQQNLDIAITNLISRNIVYKSKSEDGFTVYSIAA